MLFIQMSYSHGDKPLKTKKVITSETYAKQFEL